MKGRRSGGTVLDRETLGKSLLLAPRFSVPSGGLREIIFTPVETFHSLCSVFAAGKMKDPVGPGLWDLKLMGGAL